MDHAFNEWDCAFNEWDCAFNEGDHSFKTFKMCIMETKVEYTKRVKKYKFKKKNHLGGEGGYLFLRIVLCAFNERDHDFNECNCAFNEWDHAFNVMEINVLIVKSKVLLIKRKVPS